VKVVFPGRTKPLYILIALNSREETEATRNQPKSRRDPRVSYTLLELPERGRQYNETSFVMGDRDFVYRKCAHPPAGKFVQLRIFYRVGEGGHILLPRSRCWPSHCDAQSKRKDIFFL